MRILISCDFESVFEQVDVFVLLMFLFVAFGIGERVVDLMVMYVNDLCTLLVLLVGTFVIFVLCGLFDGLLVGLQIMVPALADDRCYCVAAAFEAVVEFVFVLILELMA